MRKVRIEDFIDILSGYAFASKKFNSDGIGLPIIRIRDVGQAESETYFDGDYDEKYLIKKGAMLIGMDGDFRLAKWKGNPSLLNQRVCRIKSNSEALLDDYLYYALPIKLKKIEDATSFVTVKHLSVKKINAIKIPLPSLEEQKAIVAKLDRAQRLIDIDKAMLTKYDQLIQSVFLDMFGDPVTNPKGWDVKSLKSVTTKIGSGATPRGGKEAYKDEGLSLIRSLNVYDNKFKYKNLAFIDDEQADKLSNVIVDEGDVLFNITGASVCRCCIVPEEILPARVNQHVSILRPKKEMLSSQFLMFCLVSDNVKDTLLGIGEQGGATRQAITKTQLQNFELILPPIEKQKEFETAVTKIEIQKVHSLSSLQRSQDLFSSMVQEVFG